MSLSFFYVYVAAFSLLFLLNPSQSFDSVVFRPNAFVSSSLSPLDTNRRRKRCDFKNDNPFDWGTTFLWLSSDSDSDRNQDGDDGDRQVYAADEYFSQDEVQVMRDLIVSLSLEASDHDRRLRVKEVFVEALAKPNGMPKRFSNLFDVVLIQVGDEVQMNAKKKFFQQAQPAAEESEDDVATVGQELVVEDGDPRSKSPEELQLWALVDMMVQSKTIVKRRYG